MAVFSSGFTLRLHRRPETIQGQWAVGSGVPDPWPYARPTRPHPAPAPCWFMSGPGGRRLRVRPVLPSISPPHWQDSAAVPWPF